jgi:hypothetical protein
MANDNDIIAKLKVEGLSQFKVEMSQSSKAVDSTTVSINKMEKAITEATDPKDVQRLTKELEAVKIASEAGATAFESSKAKLRAYKEEATGLAVVLATLKSEGKQNTQTFKDIEKQFEATKRKAGDLSDQIGDINQEIKALGSDTRGIDNVVRGATLMANGFQLVTGVQALLGKENKALSEGLLKLNGIMAVTQSIQQIGNELTREDSIVKQAATKATALYNMVVGQSTGVMKVFKIALASTGIGLLVIAIGTLVANFDKLKSFAVQLFPTLNGLGDRFTKLKDNVISFVKNGIGNLLNSFIDTYNESLTLRTVIVGIGVSFKTLAQLVIVNGKAIFTIFSSIGQAILHPTKALSILKSGLGKIFDNYKEFGGTVVKNIKDGAEIAVKSRLNRIDISKLVDEEKTKESGTKIAKEIKSKAETELQNNPVTLNVELGVTNGFDVLDAKIKETQELLESLYTGELASGGNPNENPQILYLLDQLKKLKLELETTKADFDALVNPSRATPNVPKIAGGGKSKSQPSFWDTYFGDKATQLSRAEGAKKIIEDINSYGVQISNIAEQAIQIRASNELTALEEKRDKGIITEKEYEKKSAEIKNEAARKKRAIDIANATAQIPVAVLSAYIAGMQIGGVAAPIVAGVLAGVAGAFGIAQVALIAAAPLPKFREGGSVAKRLGLIKGAKHEQGGVPIEVEGDEFVVKSQATKKYGVKMLDDINNLRFNPILSANKKLKTQSNDLRLYENLATISSYLKQGYKVDANGNQILKEISNKLNNKSIYV